MPLLLTYEDIYVKYVPKLNSRRDEWTGYAVGLEEVRNAYNILGTNLEVNSTRG